ncbi:RRXRR domain-containing protein [Streptomyces sp. NPDC054841]
MATFAAGQQTDRAVLPQQLALESASADTPGSRDETGRGRRRAPGSGHRREAISGGSPATGCVTPTPRSGERSREAHPVVFVLDKSGRPLQPTSAARARKLLQRGRAAVRRRAPFVIRLKDRTMAESSVGGVELGIHPGSRQTGITVFTATATATSAGDTRQGLYGIELAHCGGQIRDSLTRRSAYRRGRRPRNLRYRAPLSSTAALNTSGSAPARALAVAHTLDALCVGVFGAVQQHPRTIRAVSATGRGTCARTRTDSYGFPRLRLPRRKHVSGFATGDYARAVVATGKRAGTHTGRLAVRSTGGCDIRTPRGLVQGIHHRHIRLLQRAADGYAHATRAEGPTP